MQKVARPHLLSVMRRIWSANVNAEVDIYGRGTTDSRGGYADEGSLEHQGLKCILAPMAASDAEAFFAGGLENQKPFVISFADDADVQQNNSIVWPSGALGNELPEDRTFEIKHVRGPAPSQAVLIVYAVETTLS